MTARRILLAIAALSLAGMLVSSVSLYHHYGRDQSSYCDFGEKFNCDVVNRSVYSTVMGVPVALIGVVGYAGLLFVAAARHGKPRTPAVLLAAALAGLGFALYLTYIEKFVLATWCVLCLSSLGIIFAVTVLAALLAALSSRSDQARA